MKPLEKIIQTLIRNGTSTEEFGLFYGKIGMSIYFYHLSRIENNKEYAQIAEKHLDEIIEEISAVQSIDIKNGLAGISLGIDYLVKNSFVRGDINNILQNIDDQLFRTMSVAKHYEQLDAFTVIQLLYYFYVRLRSQKQDSENEYFFREICIKAINVTYTKIETTPFGGRLAYTAECELPLFLYVLSKIHSLNFYNVRIVKILSELSPVVLSTIPILHSNKLYLLWAMTIVYEHVKMNGWSEHIELLTRELNLDEIVNIELKNRSVFFSDGATSIFLLAESVKKYLGEENVCVFQQKLLEKIEQSEVWKLLETDPQYFSTHSGLYNGFCGVALLLMTCKK